MHKIILSRRKIFFEVTHKKMVGDFTILIACIVTPPSRLHYGEDLLKKNNKQNQEVENYRKIVTP